MKQEPTKQRILDKALELFSQAGYSAVSVERIAAAVGIKAPSLYNHFPSKRAIFDGIVRTVSERYTQDTAAFDIHVQDAAQDTTVFTSIGEDVLFEKVRQIFDYSLGNETIRRFRRMMTMEQFRAPELAALFTERYVTRIISYHADIFRSLIAAGEIVGEDPEGLAMLYAAPIITLIGICDRQPERTEECRDRLRTHVRLFYHFVHAKTEGGII